MTTDFLVVSYALCSNLRFRWHVNDRDCTAVIRTACGFVTVKIFSKPISFTRNFDSRCYSEFYVKFRDFAKISCHRISFPLWLSFLAPRKGGERHFGFDVVFNSSPTFFATEQYVYVYYSLAAAVRPNLVKQSTAVGFAYTIYFPRGPHRFR